MKTLRPITIVSVLMVLLLGGARPAMAVPEGVTITSGTPASPVTAYEPYPTHTFTASGGAAPYGLSLRSGVLPPGMALSSGGVLSGTPSTPGSYTFGIRMTDADEASAEQSVTVVVVAPTVTVTSDEPISPWYTGQPYPPHTFTASGGAAAYGLSLRSGVLPPGMALSSGGVLSGTPSTPGSYTFGIRLTDQHGFHADQEVTVVIAAPATTITSGRPPRGTVGEGYSFRFTAEGDAEIRFSVTAGDLPPGLTLAPDGRLSGQPEFAGSFAVTVHAAGTATSATEELSLIVDAAPFAPTPTPTATPTAPTPAPTEPSATPTEAVPTTPAAASPSPQPRGSWWLPTTGSNSALVLLLLSVVAFSIGGILLVLSYNRRRFTTPE